MGYLDNRARDFKNQINDAFGEPSGVVISSDDISSKAKFKRILCAVLALGVVAGMQYVDDSFFKRKVIVVSVNEMERVEPTFLENMFCKGNRRPKFCR